MSAASAVGAENWPSWRGPTSNGISNEKNVPAKWGREENVAWRLALPGDAGATPVVWGDRVFLTSEDGGNLVLLCASTAGKELWRRKVGSGNQRIRGDEGNLASPSPCTDGTHVWTMFGTGDLACFDFDGNEVWHINLQERYGRFNIQHSMASTPALDGDRLYVQLIHGDGRANTHEAVVAAIDRRTGKEVWRQSRITGATDENEHSYASPTLYNFGGKKFLITHGADYAIAHRLDDGSELWRLGGLNPHDDPDRQYHPALRFVASPAVASGIVVVPTAKNGPLYALRPDIKGDITDKADARHRIRPANTPDVPSPLIHDGLVYLCRENGNLICMDAQTGDPVYPEQRTEPDRYRASPVYADGKIYVTARKGVVTVIKAGREFEVIAKNDLGEVTTASPVISNGTIYIRTFDALWAIREPR
jgi:outer membrane protein assembly factor BamB